MEKDNCVFLYIVVDPITLTVKSDYGGSSFRIFDGLYYHIKSGQEIVIGSMNENYIPPNLLEEGDELLSMTYDTLDYVLADYFICQKIYKDPVDLIYKISTLVEEMEENTINEILLEWKK